MLGLGPIEIGVIIFVIVLLFGTRKLPELGSGLGEAISNFRKTLRSGNALDVTPDEEDDRKDKNQSKTSEQQSKDDK